MISETAYMYKWDPRTVLWTMNVAELVWWWQTGWAAWAHDHGVSLGTSDSGVVGGDKPDKAAFKARYGAGLSR